MVQGSAPNSKEKCLRQVAVMKAQLLELCVQKQSGQPHAICTELTETQQCHIAPTKDMFEKDITNKSQSKENQNRFSPMLKAKDHRLVSY